ncbi:hypothetical protein SUGI_0074330 [Cryptomeria japonica]|nr:hypothetical protein SUGI_0074330 [Cryptomeria japonica]
MALAAFKSTTQRNNKKNSSRSAITSPKRGYDPGGGHRRSRSFGHYSSYSPEILLHIDIQNKQEEEIPYNSPASCNFGESSVALERHPHVTVSPRGRSVSRYQMESSNDSFSETSRKLQRSGTGESVSRIGGVAKIYVPVNGRRRQRSVSVDPHYHYYYHSSEVSLSSFQFKYNGLKSFLNIKGV